MPALPATFTVNAHDEGKTTTGALLGRAPWLILLLGFLLTWAYWHHAHDVQQQEARKAFEFQSAKIRAGIEHRMRGNEQVLRGVAGLFLAKGGVDRDDISRTAFATYVSAQQIDRLHPGIQGIGFSRLLAPDELASHLASVRGDLPGYTLRPPGSRERYSSIVYLEPMDWRNRRAIGYDMFSEPVRQAAMVRARDTGQAALSGMVKLVQETEKDVQVGTLLYVPIYRRYPQLGEEIGNEHLLGWAYSPLRMRDLMESLLQRDFPETLSTIAVRLYDGPAADEAALMFSSVTSRPGAVLFAHHQLLDIAGRTWFLETTALPEFWAGHAVDRESLGAWAGGAITLLLAALVAVLQQGQRQARQAVEKLAQANERLQHSEQRFRMLTETMRDVVWVADVPSLRLRYCSPAVIQLRGYTPEELLGQPLLTGFSADSAERIRTNIQRRAEALRAGEAVAGAYYTDEIEQPRKSGDTVWTEVITNYFVDDDGVLCIRGATRDIGERKLVEEERRIAAVAFESHESTVVTDQRGFVIRANQAFSRLNGYPPEEVIGRRLNFLHSGRHDAAFYKTMWQAVQSQGFWQGEVWNRRKDGVISPQWLTITAVRDESGRPTHYVGSSFDFSERVAMESEIRNMAFYDPLTGLANRRLLTNRLSHAFAKSSRKQNYGAVIYLDLDHFKALNDHLGHAEGDRLLILVADRLTTHVREGDTVARLGGDEFVILLEDLSESLETAREQALFIAEKLRQALNQPYALQGKMPDDWHCTPSIGLALFNDHREGMELLMQRADHALYAAKNAGRNRVCVDDNCPGMPAHAD